MRGCLTDPLFQGIRLNLHQHATAHTVDPTRNLTRWTTNAHQIVHPCARALNVTKATTTFAAFSQERTGDEKLMSGKVFYLAAPAASEKGKAMKTSAHMVKKTLLHMREEATLLPSSQFARIFLIA